MEGDIFYEFERSYTHPAGMISLEYPKFLEQQFLRTAKNECLGRYKSWSSICYHDFIMLVSRTKYFNTFALVCGLLIHVEHQKTLQESSKLKSKSHKNFCFLLIHFMVRISF